MSGKLSFREQLERRESTVAEGPASSVSPVSIILRLDGTVDRPVTLIETLARWGLGLRKAHGIVTRLADGDRLPVLLPSAPEPAEIGPILERLGLKVSFPQPPATVDVKAIRAALGLTQKEFAARFCLDVGSVQNWEQGRYDPDPLTRVLLKIIERHPEVVEEVLEKDFADWP